MSAFRALFHKALHIMSTRAKRRRGELVWNGFR